MSKKVKENRDHFVGVKFTTKEYLNLRRQMENSDYLSISHYVRDKVLDRRIKVEGNFKYSKRNFRNQINSLSCLIASIGADYNMTVKRIDEMSAARKADGAPVLDSSTANYYLKQLSTMTVDVKEMMNKLIDLASRIQIDGNSTVEQPKQKLK